MIMFIDKYIKQLMKSITTTWTYTIWILMNEDCFIVKLLQQFSSYRNLH